MGCYPRDFTFDPDQPVAGGLVGPYVARGLVGSYGMLSPCDSDQLVADGPVGPSVARGPVGSYGMLSPCDSDQQVADGLVGPFIARGPVGSYGMLSPCDSDFNLDQPVADGLVDPYVTRGPVGSYGMLSPCDSDFDPVQPIAEGPVGPSVTCGPVGSHGMLSPSDSDFDPDQPVADGPVGPSVTRGPVGSYGMVSPCNSDSPGLAGQYVADGLVVVAAVMNGSSMSDVSSDGVNDSVAWDSGYQHDIIDGVTVYYVICAIQRSQIGRIQRMSLVGNMWNNIILSCWKAWNRWFLFPVVFRLALIAEIRMGLICMTATITVFMATNRSWIVNLKLGGNIVLRCFERDLVRFLWMWLCCC